MWAQINRTIKAKNLFWRGNWTHLWMSIIVVYLLQMTWLRLEFIYHPYGYIEEVCALQLRIPPIHHTITSSECAQMGNSLIWLWLSSLVIYEPKMTYPKLELICCPTRYTEEICRLQFALTSMNCTIQTLNASKRGYQIWSKLSIFDVVWSVTVKKGTKIDMSSI